MARVGAGCGIAAIHGGLCGVLNASNEPAAAAHEELAVPRVGQQETESNLGANDAVHAAVRRPDRARRCGGNRDRLRDLHVGQFEIGELRARDARIGRRGCSGAVSACGQRRAGSLFSKMKAMQKNAAFRYPILTVLAVTLSGCALIPSKPLVQGATTAQPVPKALCKAPNRRSL